jgi:hypothetical protein
VRLWAATLLGILVAGALAVVWPAHAGATTPSCQEPPTTALRETWTPSTEVKVHIDPAFSTNERSAIRNAFNNWQVSDTGLASGIAFKFPTPSLGSGQNQTFDIRRGGAPTGLSAVTATFLSASTGRTVRAVTRTNSAITSLPFLTRVIAHEIGHTFGLADAPSSYPDGSTIMNTGYALNESDREFVIGPTPCDTAVVNRTGGYGAGGELLPPDDDPILEESDCCSPIVLDVDGSGYRLTDPTRGVRFDFYGYGQPVQMSWTAPGSTNAFLVLDRNGNGSIDSGYELFGNLTEQPPSPARNGFLALAVYDKPARGGNGDGLISAHDAVFAELRLWQDRNHDGSSQPAELRTLPQLGTEAISLDYRESRRVDRHGNRFLYRARVTTAVQNAGRWTWDVFLTAGD